MLVAIASRLVTKGVTRPARLIMRAVSGKRGNKIYDGHEALVRLWTRDETGRRCRCTSRITYQHPQTREVPATASAKEWGDREIYSTGVPTSAPAEFAELAPTAEAAKTMAVALPRAWLSMLIELGLPRLHETDIDAPTGAAPSESRACRRHGRGGSCTRREANKIKPIDVRHSTYQLTYSTVRPDVAVPAAKAEVACHSPHRRLEMLSRALLVSTGARGISRYHGMPWPHWHPSHHSNSLDLFRFVIASDPSRSASSESHRSHGCAVDACALASNGHCCAKPAVFSSELSPRVQHGTRRIRWARQPHRGGRWH
jgi:hypothetical protein